jgi:hypothetical protein
MNFSQLFSGGCVTEKSFSHPRERHFSRAFPEHCLTTKEAFTDSGGYGDPTGATLAQFIHQRDDDSGPFAAA